MTAPMFAMMKERATMIPTSAWTSEERLALIELKSHRIIFSMANMTKVTNELLEEIQGLAFDINALSCLRSDQLEKQRERLLRTTK